MKELKWALLVGLIIISLGLMSNSGGRAATQGQGGTGAPGENTCGQNGCHSGGAFSPMADIVVEDIDGNPITEYFPGTTYKVTLTNTANGASEYGFQITSLDANNDRIGEWSGQSANAQITALANRTYLEQNTSSTVNEISADWTPGDTAFGDITFYAAINAVNGNNSPSGDGTATVSITIPQAVNSNTELKYIDLTMFPNPSASVINIQSDVLFQNYEMYDLMGQRVRGEKLLNNRIDISDIQNGAYLVRLSSIDKGTVVKRIIKN